MATITDQQVEDFYLGKTHIDLNAQTFDIVLDYVNAQEQHILRMMRDVDGYSHYSELVHESSTHDVFRALINEERERAEMTGDYFLAWVRHNLRSIQRMSYVMWSIWSIRRPEGPLPLTLKSLTVAAFEGQQNYLRSKVVGPDLAD